MLHRLLCDLGAFCFGMMAFHYVRRWNRWQITTNELIEYLVFYTAILVAIITSFVVLLHGR